MRQTRLLALSAMICVVLVGAVFPCARALAAEAEPDQPKSVPIDELRTFAEIFGRIKKDYVEPVEDSVLLEYAVRGMLSGLDPHSAYLNAEDYKELRVGTSGKFGGLGIEVGMEDGFVKVISPIDDTPAQRAGVLAGDLIIRLDEKPVKGMDLSEAVKNMRGKPGTKITLTIVRESEEKPIKITIVRDIINVASVKSRVLEPGFGYVRISNFQSRTADDMTSAVAKLKAGFEGKIKGLVLDLRNNPGGILNSAIAVSDAYLNSGKIVYTEGKAAGSKLEFSAEPGDILEGSPVVVLVNGGSASASEIVAGALQDHRRALIMGNRTFGKGSVQSIIPVTRGAAIKLTTARYYTPSGRSIQAEGIIPDIQLQRLEVSVSEQSEVGDLKEADLNRHLDNGDSKEPHLEQEAQDKENGKEKSLAVTDYQLYEALNLLKGLSLLGVVEH